MVVRLVTAIASAALTAAALAGCAAAPEVLIAEARDDAAARGFQARTLQTSSYGLFSLRRDGGPDAIVHVYLEGDGFAWDRPNRPSFNPTPRNPVAMRLAMADPAPQVVYLARPCQYRALAEEPLCDRDVWSVDRYAPAEIQAVREALDQVKAESGARSVGLNGYSGAGPILIALAAERDDVAYLRTVAATLDPVAFTTWHGVTPLRRPVSTREALAALKDLPQAHYVSKGDAVIPPALSEKALRAAGLLDAAAGCVAFTVLDGPPHGGPWPLDAAALARRPGCAAAGASSETARATTAGSLR